MREKESIESYIREMRAKLDKWEQNGSKVA